MSAIQVQSNLLRRINEAVPVEIQQRFDELTQKRQAETLTHEEHQELFQLVDIVEELDVQRLKALAELAQLRRVPIRELMSELGLQSTGV